MSNHSTYTYEATLCSTEGALESCLEGLQILEKRLDLSDGESLRIFNCVWMTLQNAKDAIDPMKRTAESVNSLNALLR